MSKKQKFTQMELDTVKEVLNMNKANEETAVGYESLNEDSDDMVQDVMQETAMAKAEREKTWDNGKRDGSVDEVEEEEKPAFGSLSSKMSNTDFRDEDGTDGNRQDEDLEKAEKLKKKENSRLKKELKLMDLKLTQNGKWLFSPVIPCYRQGELKKYITIISAYDLATMWENSIKYINSIQRGSKLSSSGQEKDNFSPKHVTEIFHAFTQNRIFGNTIVLNYSLDSESELVYNQDENSISGEGYLQAVDCSHRARAALKWKSAWVKNPDQYDDPKTISIYL